MGQSRAEVLGELARKQGVKAVLFDVDDTLYPFSERWEVIMREYAAEMGKLADSWRDDEEIFGEVKRVNTAEYHKSERGVHPSKYAAVARQTAEWLGVNEAASLRLMRQATRRIYYPEPVPELTEEGKQSVAEVQEAGLAVALVTHSPQGRIERMVKAWGMEGIPVFWESTLRRKSPQVWRRALAGMSVQGGEAVNVGDNMSGDMQAGREAGIGLGVHVKPQWSAYAGEEREGVIEVDGVGLVVPALIAYWTGNGDGILR